MIQKPGDLRGAELLWVTLTVEVDKAFDSMHIRFFGSITVMTPSHCIAHSIQ